MIEKLFNFYPEAYSLNDFMYAFSTENPQFPLLMGIATFTFFIGYWVLTSDYYSFNKNPWFYILGIVSIFFAARGVYIYKNHNKKDEEVIPGMKSVR